MNSSIQLGTILVACVGNIFLGDDGFGVEVARSLSRRPLSRDILVKDYGIRGFDLAYALLEPWKAVILVDALPRNDDPGTLYIVKPDLSRMGDPAAPGMEMNPHGMDPVHVLNLALTMGPILAPVFLVGCQPDDFGDELDGRMGLSAPVQAAVEEASNMVEELVAKIKASATAIQLEELGTAQ
ncbi:MAG: hydrogenase maturation protease [Edaphobacter sp.]|nr:hydrogenase maturation protease [Edaphobacter sp.]